MTALTPDQLAARAAASQRLAISQGRRDAVLQTGAKLALTLLQEDREALITGHRTHADDIAGDEIVMDSGWAQERLAAYDAAIAEMNRAFGPLQQEVDRLAAAYRTQLGLPAAEGRP